MDIKEVRDAKQALEAELTAMIIIACDDFIVKTGAVIEDISIPFIHTYGGKAVCGVEIILERI